MATRPLAYDKWRQWVALVAAFTLDDLVSHSHVTLPNPRGDGTVKLGHETED